MRRSDYLSRLAFALLSISTVSHADAATVDCTSIKGTQLEYLNQSKADHGEYAYYSVNDTTLESSFKVMTNDANPGATLTFPADNTVASSQTQQVNLTLVNKTNKQMTYTGMWNNAPLMLTLYPKNKTGIYSQHNVYGNHGQGVRVNLTYAHCEWHDQASAKK